MPKIAVVGSRNMPANYGGVETACENLYACLAKKGVEILALCRSEAFRIEIHQYKQMSILNIPTIDVAGLGTFLHCLLTTLIATFSDADIIHFHAQGPALFSIIPRLLSPRKKLGFTCQGRDWQRDKWGKIAKTIIKQGEVHSARYTDFRIMVSNDLKNYYRSVYGVESVRIPNGVDLPKPTPSGDFCQRFDLEKSGYLLFIGRLVPEKAPDILIQAFSQINTDIKLVIAGDSPETPEYVQQLKNLAQNNPNIVFTSHIRGADIAEAYDNALAYVSPSKLEGNPITALEAMSYALPLLISDIPPHEEILSFYKKGLVLPSFKADSVDACREGLVRLLDMPKDTLREIGLESRNVVRTAFSWDTIAEETLDIYRDVLASGEQLGKQHPAFAN